MAVLYCRVISGSDTRNTTSGIEAGLKTQQGAAHVECVGLLAVALGCYFILILFKIIF